MTRNEKKYNMRIKIIPNNIKLLKGTLKIVFANIIPKSEAKILTYKADITAKL
jgi:hypothetical protein